MEKPEPSPGRVDRKVLWMDCSHEPSAAVLIRALRSHVQLGPGLGPVHGQPRPAVDAGFIPCIRSLGGTFVKENLLILYSGTETRAGGAGGITSPRHMHEQALKPGPSGYYWEVRPGCPLSYQVCLSMCYLSCAVLCPVAKSCPTLCHPMDYSRPGSSVHGIFQARILEQVTISYSRGSPQPTGQTHVSCIS